MSVVYGLAHPTTGEIRYVGKTCIEPERRFKEHVDGARRSRNGQRRLFCWIRSLEGRDPVLVILQKEPLDLNLAERYWIAKFRSEGARLCNMTDGGDGRSPGFKQSEATKEKLRAHRHTEASKRKISESLKGKKHTPEAIQKMVRAATGRIGTMKGKRHTPEALARMSESQKQAYSDGRKVARVGVPHTLEARAKISEANRRAYAEGRRKKRATLGGRDG